MDPQKLSQLDPKLRDAYQRVMGTPIPPPATPPIQEPPVQPEPSTPQSPVSEPQPAIPKPQPPTPQPAISPEPPVQASSFGQMNSEVAVPSSPNFSAPMPQAQTMTVKKKNGMMPILIGIAGLFFVAIYTLFWAKIFNFKLPFLP